MTQVHPTTVPQSVTIKYRRRIFNVMDDPTLFQSIGNTPLIRLKNICPNPEVRLLAKLEGSNPGGSVKDRPALWMIRNAEERGELTKGKIILEATSGNTGIAIAMIGTAKGYKVTLVMPECVSIERRKILEAYGAELILTPGCERTDGAIRKAREIYQENPERYYMPDQFTNPDNPLSHYESTGPEILAQSGGDLDIFIAGLGTSGTLVGTSRFLREKLPKVRIIAVEPLKGHAIQGLKNMEEAIVPMIYDPRCHDEKMSIPDEEAFEMARQLARREGLFVGMSSGAAVACAIKKAKEMRSGTIVTILPDRGDRYLSTHLFRPSDA